MPSFILALIVFIFIIIFKKQIKQFLCRLYNLIENKIIKPFFNNHQKLRKIIKDRFDKNNKYGLKLTIFLTLILICVIWFISIGEGYINQELIYQYDFKLNNLFLFFRNQNLTNIFTFITNIADPKMILIGTVLFSVFLYISKNKEYLFPFFISIGSTTILDYVLKFAFNRPRPSMSLYIESNASFPSGHSSIIVAFIGFICYFIVKNSKKNKALYIITCIVICLLVGVSRLYLGAHYLSDILGGFLLGSVSLLSSICISELFFINNSKEKRIKNLYLFVLIFIVILIFFTILFKRTINSDKISFQNDIYDNNLKYLSFYK